MNRLVCLIPVAAAILAPHASAQPANPPPHETALGVKLTPVPDSLYAHLPSLERGQGLLVESIKPSSRAAEIGLKVHDVVLTIGTTPIKNGEELNRKLTGLPAGEREVLQIVRGGKPFALTVAPAASAENAYTPPKSLFKPGGPPAVSVEIKSLTTGTMEVTLFYLNQANKMDRRALQGSLEDIERQVGDLAKMGQMPENIHDLVSLALKRVRTKTPQK
jgi:hypothetical protein